MLFSDEIKLAIELGGFAITVGIIVWRLSALTTKLETLGTNQAGEITEIKNAITRMEPVVTTVAVQKVQIDNYGATLNQMEKRMDARLDRLERQFDELRHGKGWVMEAPAMTG